MKLVPVSALMFCVALSAAPLEAGVILDGDFSNWGLGSVAPDGSSATVTREETGGNPGARLKIATSARQSATAFGTALKNDFSTLNPLSGTFTLSLDVLSDPQAFGGGQAISLLVAQGDSIYEQFLGVTNVQANFTTLTFNGSFDDSFVRLTGTGTLDLDGGELTRVGFAGSNSSSSITNYYDNFRLESDAITAADPSAVPEPASLTLLGLGGLGLAGGAWRKRRKAAS